MRRRQLLMAVLLLWGCARQERPLPPPVVPDNFPIAYYRQATAMGTPVYRIVPRESLITIIVRRAGTLAGLGHDHVISSQDIHGFVALRESRADLYMPLDTLAVDVPELRAEAGLDTRPSASDVAGTRANMLSSLEAQRYPHVMVSINAMNAQQLDFAITLHGVTRRYLGVPAMVETRGDVLAAGGTLAVEQSEFGIAPFSILGGAIRVADRLEIRFRLVARREMQQ